MRWLGLPLLAGLVSGGYYIYPVLVVLLAPLCAVFAPALRTGQVIATPRNTVICPTFARLNGLAGKTGSLIDLPPWLLVRNGCYPAPNVMVEIAAVQGRFIAVRLLHAEDKNRQWWTLLAPSSVHG